jgi:polyhydroxybutyrate depolymerase
MKKKKLIFYSLTNVMIIGIIGYYFLFVKERLKAPNWNLQTNAIIIEGIERTFDFYVPENLSSSPSLVFLLHGSDGTSQLMRYLTNYEFEKQANQRNNFILVYPQGFEKHWNDCRGTATYTANTSNINDISFFKEMISFFNQKYIIDEGKIYSIGYSNGGQMCLKLAFELPEIFKGIGVYTANIPELANNDCKPKNLPISTIIINGTEDPINPYGGGLVIIEGDSSRGSVLSSMQSFEYFKNLLPDKCLEQSLISNSYSEMVSELSASCSNSGYQVKLIKIQDGGHTMPLISKPPYLPARIGKTETSINSAKLILDFFEGLK